MGKKNFFLAVLGLCRLERPLSSCGERGLLFIVLPGLLTVLAALVEGPRPQEHSFQQLQCLGSAAVARGLGCS